MVSMRSKGWDILGSYRSMGKGSGHHEISSRDYIRRSSEHADVTRLKKPVYRDFQLVYR